MAFISFGKIDKNLIPVLLGSIACFLNRLLNTYKEASLFKNVVLTNICISSSKLFAIIPLILIKVRSKSTKTTKIQNLDNVNSSKTKLSEAVELYTTMILIKINQKMYGDLFFY